MTMLTGTSICALLPARSFSAKMRSARGPGVFPGKLRPLTAEEINIIAPWKG